MKKLQRKLVRDLLGSKGLFLAISAVILLGVAIFGASYMGYQNLKTSYDYTYEKLHFADFTVQVVDASEEAVADIEAIPGVDAVVGRMNKDFTLTIPGETEKKVLGRVISLPPEARPAVNDVKVEEGSYFLEDGSSTLLVEKSFAEHHKLTPGDAVSLSTDSQEISFQIAGIVTSPEYIWPAKNRQEVFVFPENFGVVFIPQNKVSELVGELFTNEFCITVDEAADREAVISRAEEALAPYTIINVITSEEQPSNAALKLDLDQFSELSQIFPLLFLIVGALATYILLTRIVHNQRAQIGLMQAVGYSRRQVLTHYLSFALVIGITGAVTGIIVGFLLSGLITHFYVGFLGLPYTRIDVHWGSIVEGLLMGIVPCAIAGIIPAYNASRVRPAEAMRTPPPSAGRKLLLERLLPFLTRLSNLWKIPLRNVFRNRRRSLYTIIGVAFGVSLILVSAGMIDSIDSLINFHFNKVQRYDVRITFAQPQSVALVEDVQAWEETDGDEVEPLLELPTRLEYGDNSYTTLTLGLSADAELYGLYSTGGERVYVGDQGILLSEGLQDTLGVDKGDDITLVSQSGREQMKVAGFVSQTMGGYSYISLSRAQELAGGSPVVSGLMIGADPQYLDAIKEKAYAIPGVASVELTTETKSVLDDMMDLANGFLWIMLAFGAALSLAIVFTTVTVNIMERRREIATMRTLGEGKGRIAAMLTIENLILGLVGLIPGIPLGYFLAAYFLRLAQTDMMSFDLVIYARTYVMTIGMVILIMLVSQVPSIRHSNRMDLAKVTKEQAT